MLPVGRETKDAQGEKVPVDGDAWTTLDQTVRHIDEDKVKDCKDDMDTLLVFAGLYSAVLTAFLIESYKNLIPDPQKTMVQLLGQISSQTSSYTISDGFLNSTAPPPSPLPPPSPFHAAITDVRVNVCWFASLILSLSTASFGILVKQWLREYLAVDRTVPQERIRIRHFRYYGLEEWKLFEIAAALPLVLQFSLALFFTGLCFFTSEIHPSVRTTSLCLVSGWALLFSFTFLAPLVSARCPYKTTFLKSAFRRLRPHVRSFIKALAGVIREFLSVILPLLSPILPRLYQLLRRFLCRINSAAITVLRRATSRVRRPAASSEVQEAVLTEGSEKIEDSDQPERSDHLLNEDQVVSRSIEKYVLEEDMTVQEEDEIRRAESQDLVIFKNVDAILLDDHLLATMRGALQRRPPRGEEVLRFVSSAIAVRLNTQLHANDNGHIYADRFTGFGGLSSTTCIALASILADALLHSIAQSTSMETWLYDDHQPWIDDAFRIVIALVPLRHPMPESVTSVFQQLLSRSPQGDYNGCAMFASNIVDRANTTSRWQSRSFMTIVDALKVLEPSTLLCIVHWSYVDWGSTNPEDDTYGRILDQVKRIDSGDLDPSSGVTYGTLIVLVGVASSVLHAISTSSEAINSKRLDESKALYLKQLLQFVVDAVPVIKELFPLADLIQPQIPGGVGVRKLFVAFSTTPALVSLLLECFEAQPKLFSSSTRNILWDSFQAAARSLSKESRTNILSIFVEYFDTRCKTEPTPTVLMTLHLYLAFSNFPLDDSNENYVLWKRLCYTMIECVKKTGSFHPISMPFDADATALEEQTLVGEVAYSILQLTDQDHEDGMRPYRIGRPSGEGGVSGLTQSEVEDENDRYSRWAKQFNVDNSFYPDEKFATLRQISHSTTDARRRTFWRVRRAEDMEREAQRIDCNAVALPDVSLLHLRQSVAGESAATGGEVTSTDEVAGSRGSGRMNPMNIWTTVPEFSFVPPCN